MPMNRHVLTAALTALAFTAGGAAPAAADPGDRDVGALLAELRGLYRETGEAAEAYNAAEERLRDRRDEAAELGERLAAARTDLAGARRAAGAVAREQYRQGGLRLPGHLRLLFGDAPARDLHAQAVAERAATAQAARIRRLLDGERRADELATRAREALDAEQSAAAERRRQRDEAHRRLDEIAGLLAGLTPQEAAELGEQEAARAERARRSPVPAPEPGSELGSGAGAG
ncbi:hypothetical protein [Streptomyces sp. MP131-18]|uniref:hypothetical protein n=1 Tax=Streptomyces sp. MP131-18 TaxID=1857892 RepID=UPI00097CB6DE|nr:hypothetical protein [Streptomyces sp. MP131-18]ONK11376.1 hypothetical protein STBA_21070 [Streptomyces sp. MP131-18]